MNVNGRVQGFRTGKKALRSLKGNESGCSISSKICTHLGCERVVVGPTLALNSTSVWPGAFGPKSEL